MQSAHVDTATKLLVLEPKTSDLENGKRDICPRWSPTSLPRPTARWEHVRTRSRSPRVKRLVRADSGRHLAMPAPDVLRCQDCHGAVHSQQSGVVSICRLIYMYVSCGVFVCFIYITITYAVLDIITRCRSASLHCCARFLVPPFWSTCLRSASL